jgi:hypothetical protein
MEVCTLNLVAPMGAGYECTNNHTLCDPHHADKFGERVAPVVGMLSCHLGSCLVRLVEGRCTYLEPWDLGMNVSIKEVQLLLSFVR